MVAAVLLGGTPVTAATPNSDPEKIGHLKGHMIVAASIGVLMLASLVVRLVSRHPPPACSGMAWVDKLSPWAHRALYLAVFIHIGSGLTMAVMAGLPDIVFNGQVNLPKDFWHLPAR